MAAPSDVSDLATDILLALSAMAAHSGRHQAEVVVALYRAGLRNDATQVLAALGLLQAEQCVSDLVALADGGLLLTVTGRPRVSWTGGIRLQEA